MRMMVLEYPPNGTVYEHLHGKKINVFEFDESSTPRQLTTHKII